MLIRAVLPPLVQTLLTNDYLLRHTRTPLSQTAKKVSLPVSPTKVTALFLKRKVLCIIRGVQSQLAKSIKLLLLIALCH